MSRSKKLTEEQIESMKGEFLTLDSDGDGTITIKELEKILLSMRNKLRCSERDIQHFLKDIDKNGDGEIDLREYHKIMKDKGNRDLIHRALVHRSSARKQFAKFDKDGSGYITEDEIRAGFMELTQCNMTTGQVETIIKNFDRNDDGNINYEEFVLMMTK